MNRKIVLFAGLFVLCVLPIIAWGVTSLSERGTVKVSLFIAPQDATLKIGDKEFTNNKEIRIAPGTYSAVVSKDGFESNTQSVTIAEGAENTIIAPLTPVSSEAKKWYRDNQSLYLKIEGKAGEIAAQDGKTFIEKYPITKWLPLQKSTYLIGYKRVSDTSKEGIIITISATEGYREAALQEIRDKKFNPGDYKIEFTNYRSPFNE